MSEVFEGYERQYCEASASLSRKCTAASALDGEKKKQKLSEIQSGMEEAESLIRKMDLEARSLQPSVKAGMADTLAVSTDQRGRLMMTTERLNQSTDRIKESRRTMLETEELGVSILQDLHQQRQSLLHAHTTLHGVDDNIGKSKKILAAMSKRMDRNKWIIGGIITALVLAILIILYFKLAH
ncbi:hypothetical protein PVAP13_5NG081300 [Panicum virgatum]|uniref:Vesicle transport v-SNARE N-terminal domain-containing protein n=1 Tax=Panicum virgatum TaxID=38727 RepID=A0A8T0RZU7_PANVG|nr:hypothetical protein PVAP13_5NG081300 [Panicum virgatum]